jgi:hypothetical protein
VLATNFVGLAEPRAGSTELTSTRPYYAAVLDRPGRYEPAATIAGFAEVNPFATTAFPGLGTAVTHLRNVLGDETYSTRSPGASRTGGRLKRDELRESRKSVASGSPRIGHHHHPQPETTRSHTRGKTVVPSPWQATTPLSQTQTNRCCGRPKDICETRLSSTDRARDSMLIFSTIAG